MQTSCFTLRLLALMLAAPALMAFAPTSRFGRLNSPLRMASDEFTIGVLGDLHLDPRVMEDYEVGRSHWLPIFEEAKQKHGNVALVSLGDLGESKSINPKETSELFAGTTACHELAAEYLSSFGLGSYEVVGGNHGKYLQGDSLCFDRANGHV